MAWRKKPGPKPKAGARYPSGDLKPVDDRPAGLIARRADLVGPGEVLNQMAAYPLGQLVFLEAFDGQPYCTIAQHDAGIALRNDWRRWKASEGLPPHLITQKGGGAGPDVGEVDAAARRKALEAALGSLRRAGYPDLALATIESIVMDEVLPPSWINKTVPRRVVEAFRGGLDALVLHYRTAGLCSVLFPARGARETA